MSEGTDSLSANTSQTSDESVSRGDKMAYGKNKYWFVCDPCGIVCAVMTYLLIVYGELVVLVVLAPPFPTVGTGICVFIFTTFAVLAIISHVKSMITDPVSAPLAM